LVSRFARSGLKPSVLASVLGALLAGCGSSAIPTYDLTAPQQFPRAGGGRGQLVVAEPAALAVLDTDRIVVRPGGGQVAQLGGAQWSDRLPKLLQARVVQAFENANRQRAVGKPGDRISADYQLVIDIRAFNLSAATSPTGEVELSAKIIADRAGRIVAARVFRASVPAGASEGPEAVRAIDEAFGRVATELVIWAGRAV
jgi:cholesterol transport system auxiliary component